MEMKAEEKLAQLLNGWRSGKSTSGGVYIAAEQIDLIANLVVERLKKELKIENKE